MLPPWLVLDPMLDSWLREDWGRGDWTTASLFPSAGPPIEATILLKESGVVCGLPLAARILQRVDPAVQSHPLVAEGDSCKTQTPLMLIQGSPAAILMAERVMLNLLQRLSGIATTTRTYVDILAATPCRLTDTRKTTPGLRILEKYAVRTGGGVNHRLGLDDAVMIKDNHIVAAGSITEAVRRIRQHLPHLISIEVECETLDQVQEALALNVDMLLLDNMTIPQLQEVVQLVQGRIPLEASGRITLDTLLEVAATGVDYIATSAPMTRSRWLDISLDF
jgi:nicotinate-nucleotide pyrophosphorylase (carboxylating)